MLLSSKPRWLYARHEVPWLGSSLGSHLRPTTFPDLCTNREAALLIHRKHPETCFVNDASFPIISKAAFTVICFDWEPLEIPSNPLLKFSKIPLLIELGGQKNWGKGGISLLWLHMIWFCDLQSLKKNIELIHKQPGTKILLVSFYCTSGNQLIMCKTLGDWKGWAF